jgi:uncharacterized protein YndB with AHSA1/START domain
MGTILCKRIAMASNKSILTINAPIQKVWDALTKPDLVKQWQYGSKLITDWKPGSSIRFVTEWDGKVFEQWGTVVEVVPLKLIKYSLFAPRPGVEDKPENYFLMNYKLTQQNPGVLLEINQDDDRPGAVQAEVQGEENPVLKMLKEVAEKV